MNTKKIKNQPISNNKQKSSKTHPIAGIAFFTLALLITVALGDYHPTQSRWISTAATYPNKVGAFGSFTAFWSYFSVGLGSWFLPIFLAWSGYLISSKKRLGLLSKWRILLMAGTLLSFAGLMDLAYHTLSLPPSITDPNFYPNGPGGSLGKLLFSKILQGSLGIFGSTFILIVTYLTCCLLSFSIHNTANETLDSLSEKGLPLLEKLKRSPRNLIHFVVETSKKLLPKPKAQNYQHPIDKTVYNSVENSSAKEDKTPTKQVKAEEEPQETKAKIPLTKFQEAKQQTLKIFTGEKVEKASIPTPQRQGDYIFPSLDILQTPPTQSGMTPEEHQQVMDDLVQTLAEFGVKVTPGEVHTGPVVTRYEVIPAAGVRVEKISNLSKNIALSLRAISVRILAPVPGKASVGIEIPNSKPAPVFIREILESKAWVESNAEIPIVLGKEVTGRPLVADLTKMPHLLIAGSTGSGKTVCINTIISSLLYHASPQDLRFIMVDPKIVEMQLYNDIPHMLIPVVTSPKKVPAALKWLISEMEHRYQTFANVGVRNIAAFNAKILKDKKESERAEELDAEMSPEERAALNNIEVPRSVRMDEIPKEKLPYIVCIVDELADLMMVAPADIELCVMRLAQLARAAGIHLILATQRPSVNVITGVIKANLPCRIAFKVASKVDSRTILDGGGADQLIGKGDMLFIPPGASDLVRAQGAYASDDEINAIIDALKVNGPPEYADHVQQQIESADEDDNEPTQFEGEWSDELMPAALEVIKASKRASTSMLQRRLKIGYNRAARIMEALEAEGYVGPENAQNPREILVDLDA